MKEAWAGGRQLAARENAGILFGAACVVKEIFRIGTVMKGMIGGNFQKPRIPALAHATGKLARNHATGAMDYFVGHYDDGG